MRFRLAMAGNLTECRAMLHPGFAFTGCPDDRLPELWARLLENDRAAFVVVDDPAQPWPQSLEGFMASVFVTDAFVDEFRTAGRPCLSAAVYERMLAGGFPVLTATQVRAANSAHGLNLALLHVGVRTSGISDRRAERALRQIGAALFFLRSGYRLNVVLAEAFGRQQASFMLGAGFRRLDVSLHDSRSGRVPPDRLPHLFMTRKQWNAPAALGQVSMLFHAPAASLGLSRAEQRAVLGALLGQTDREIAATCAVSVDAVKKTWRRIHERMASTIPYLEDSTHLPSVTDQRSAEKRRRLVEYLRYHLEELRPNGGSRTRALRVLANRLLLDNLRGTESTDLLISCDGRADVEK